MARMFRADESRCLEGWVETAKGREPPAQIGSGGSMSSSQSDAPGPGSDAHIVGLLRRHPGFASLGDDELQSIVRLSTTEDVPESEAVFHQNDRGDYAFLVLDGEMLVEVETDIGTVTVAVIEPGGMVGEIAAFADRPRTATVRAKTATRLLCVNRTVIHTLLEHHPSAAMAIIGDLGDRLLRLNGTIATLTQATTALAHGEFKPEMLQNLKKQADRFSQFAEVFTDMANEITHKRNQAQEMKTAAEIQRSFLPKPLPSGVLGEACTISASMIPAKEVGGDFYDYFMLGENRLAFAIGDVSGKGVPAAMFMSVSRTMLKAVASAGGTAGEILTHVNEVLSEEGGESMFVTLFFAILDLESGNLEYSSAGHDEAYLLRERDPVRQLGHNGPAIGLLEDFAFPTMRLQLAPGDAMFLATDGVTEAFNPKGELFERERLERVLQDAGDRGAAALVAAVNQSVNAFAAGAERSDDTTCLAVNYCGAPSAR